ncbi:eukaryotic translation initiation factor 2 subunit 2 isoform X3 [Centroberyx gerrardi]
MSGDEMIFDPNMSKKKKKKKKPFMLDEEGGDGGSEDAAPPEDKDGEQDGEEREPEPDEDEGKKKEISDDLDDLNFFNQKKKKKKKAKTFDSELEEGMKELKILAEPAEGPEDDDMQLLTKKKKKKQVNFLEDVDDESEDDGQEEEEGKNADDIITFSSQSGPAWAGSERDYTYDELLNRVFNVMREKNPDMVAGEKRKFVMKPPQVVRVGTKKTSFVNFTDICKLGSIDGNNQLVIKGRFQQKQIENVLRRYIKEYVTCHTCRSPDTILQKDTRLYFLQCESCHSRCSVASIKTGFQAVTGKRAQLRAKAN